MMREQIEYGYYQSPIGWLEVAGTVDAVTSIVFVEDVDGKPREISSEAVRSCMAQLEEYFQGERTEFDLPLRKIGTPFQNEVWSEVGAVAYGELATYRDIAARISRDKAVRAVGTANGRNRFAIVVPCHRVIGSDGSMHGYAWGIWRKEWLLEQERKSKAGC